MAVREDEDRRVGGHPEKFLTLEDAARRLHCPADDVEAMVRAGELEAFRLGGNLLRVRLADVEAIQRNRPLPVAGQEVRSLRDRLADFLYFNDFYLVALLIILTLLAVIFAL